WEGGALVFTDPNGTRPATQAELVETWSRPLPEKFRTGAHPEGLMQKDALVAWATDHEGFREANGTDRWEDLQRLLSRLAAAPPPPSLHRGMKMGGTDLDAFLR